jgi:hypothetical protein
VRQQKCRRNGSHSEKCQLGIKSMDIAYRDKAYAYY